MIPRCVVKDRTVAEAHRALAALRSHQVAEEEVVTHLGEDILSEEVSRQEGIIQAEVAIPQEEGSHQEVAFRQEQVSEEKTWAGVAHHPVPCVGHLHQGGIAVCVERDRLWQRPNHLLAEMATGSEDRWSPRQIMIIDLMFLRSKVGLKLSAYQVSISRLRPFGRSMARNLVRAVTNSLSPRISRNWRVKQRISIARR